MKSAIAALLMLTAGAANASQWTTLAQGPVASLVYETTTLKRHGTHVLLWVRVNYTQPRQDITGRYNAQMWRADIDCATDTIGFRGSSKLLGGKIVYAGDLQTDGDVIQPDSTFYTVEQAVCK